MQPVRIYDPERVPRHWAEVLNPGDFAVFIRDVQTQQTLDAAANPALTAADEHCYVFDDMIAARAFCNELVGREPHAQCEIFDERGMAVEPIYTIVNERHEHRIGSKRTAKLLMLCGVLSVVVTPPLFYYDWLSAGARIWPTMLGLNLVFLGLRLLHWGYNELERLRAREEEQARFEGPERSASSKGTA